MSKRKKHILKEGDGYSYFGLPVYNLSTPPVVKGGSDWPYGQGHTPVSPEADALAPSRPWAGDIRTHDHGPLTEEEIEEGVYPHTQLDRPMGTGNGLGHNAGWTGSIYPPWFEDRANIEDKEWDSYNARWGSLQADPVVHDALSPIGRRNNGYGGYVGVPSMTGTKELEISLAEAIEKHLEDSICESVDLIVEVNPLQYLTKAGRQNIALQQNLGDFIKKVSGIDFKKLAGGTDLDIIETDPNLERIITAAKEQAGATLRTLKKQNDAKWEALEKQYKADLAAEKSKEQQEIIKKKLEGMAILLNYQQYQKDVVQAALDGEEPPKPPIVQYALPPEEFEEYINSQYTLEPKVREDFKRQVDAEEEALDKIVGDLHTRINGAFYGLDPSTTTVETYLRHIIDQMQKNQIPIKNILNVTSVVDMLMKNVTGGTALELTPIRTLMLQVISAIWKDKNVQVVLKDVAAGNQTKWFGAVSSGDAELPPQQQAAPEEEPASTEPTEDDIKADRFQAAKKAAATLGVDAQAIASGWEKGDNRVFTAMLPYMKLPQNKQYIEQLLKGERAKHGGGRPDEDEKIRQTARYVGPTVKGAALRSGDGVVSVIKNLVDGAIEREGGDATKAAKYIRQSLESSHVFDTEAGQAVLNALKTLK